MTSSRFRHTLIALLCLWFGVVAFASYLMLDAEIHRHERDFDEHARHLAADIKKKLDMNEAVLDGFAAFLQAVERNDAASATRYAAAVAAAYPHIYMLEVARQIPLNEQLELEASLRRELLPSFTIKDFPWLTRRKLSTPSTQNHTWPITFMYPALPEAERIYGVRLETVSYLSQTLALAHKAPRPVVSPLFEMYEGGNAYILLREVERKPRAEASQGPNIFGSNMIALILIKASALIPTIPPDEMLPTDIAYSASLVSANLPPSVLFTVTAPPSGWLDRILLPEFSRRISINNGTQPIIMSFNQQLRWHDVLSVNLLVILIVLACVLVTLPALMLRHVNVLEREEREHERSAYLATHDLLTGLPNRFLFNDRFEQAVLQHTRNGNSFALLLIDLDHFKEINDRHGHEVGDEILIAAAQRMSGEVRACDTVARHGGDEFVVLLANILSIEDAEIVGHKLCKAIARPVSTHAGELNLTCSIGIAAYPTHGHTLDTLRKSADQSMYQAKALGRNTVATAIG